jgi:DNA-binding beta-propeller fold protein YncE
MKKVWLIVFVLCFSLPAFGGSLHFGIIDAVKEQKKELKRKIEERERRKTPEAVEEGYVYVSCAIDENYKVGIFDRKGRLVKWFGKAGMGNGEFGTHSQFFNFLRMAVDRKKNVYVVDMLNFRIQKFNSEGEFISIFADWSLAKDFIPIFIATDNEKEIFYVSGYYPKDKVKTLKFDKYGSLTGEYEGIQILAIDEENMYGFQENFETADFVYKFNKHGEVLHKLDHQFEYPKDIVLNNKCNIFVLDSKYIDRYSKIQKFDQEGKFILEFGEYGVEDGKCSDPWGIAVDSQGNIYVADTKNQRIQVFDNNGKFLEKFGGDLE